MLATSDSASQYRERLDKARGSSRRPFTCVSVLPREEGASLRPVMQALRQPFTQRTVPRDVLMAIEQQVRKLEDVVNTSSGVSSEGEEEDCNDDENGDEHEEEEPAVIKVLAVTEKPRGKKRYLNASLKQDSNIPSNRTKPTDEFFSGIESKVSAMDAVLVVTSSNKSRQKKLRRKRKKQQQRTESRLDDTDSDDDESDDDEEEDGRPPQVARGAGSRSSQPVAKKRMSSTTEALTDVGVKGVKKYRNALTYQEKSLYNKTYGNPKK